MAVFLVLVRPRQSWNIGVQVQVHVQVQVNVLMPLLGHHLVMYTSTLLGLRVTHRAVAYLQCWGLEPLGQPVGLAA